VADAAPILWPKRLTGSMRWGMSVHRRANSHTELRQNAVPPLFQRITGVSTKWHFVGDGLCQRERSKRSNI
jgi:hypothetical protein